jgi:hypothetical protein
MDAPPPQADSSSQPNNLHITAEYFRHLTVNIRNITGSLNECAQRITSKGYEINSSIVNRERVTRVSVRLSTKGQSPGMRRR